MEEGEYQDCLRSLEVHLVDWQYIRLVTDEGMLTGDVRLSGMIEPAPDPYVVGERIVTGQILETGQGWCATYRQKYFLNGKVRREKLMTLDQLKSLKNK